MSFGASKRGAFGSTSADTEPSAVAPDPRGNPNYDLIRRSRQPLTGSPPRPMDPAIVLGSVTAVLLFFENQSGNLKRQRLCLLEQRSVSSDVIDQTKTPGFIGADGFAGQHHLQCAAATDFSREPLGAAVAWNHAEFGFRQTELSVLRRDSEMTGERQLAAATGGDAIDRRNKRNTTVFDQITKRLATLGNFVRVIRVKIG